MNFEEPIRRDPRLEQGRQHGGTYQAQAIAADRLWAIRCGNLLRGPQKKVVHLQELSANIWKRADAAHNFRVALERQKSVEHKAFDSDMKKCNDRLKTEGNPHDGLVLANLDARSIAIQCAHGFHIRCSHGVRRRQ